MRPEENSKRFITVAKPTERGPFFLGASWTFVSLDPVVPKRDSPGINNLINGVNCSRNTVSKSNGARKSQNLQVESEARRNQSVLCMCQLVWLGAMVSSDSLLWSRMSHLHCRW